MNKTKLLISLGFLILILLFIPFNKSYANMSLIQSNGTSYTLENGKVGGTLELGGYGMSHPVWENKSLYCIEPDQGLKKFSTMSMTVEYYVEIVGNKITYKKGTIEKTETLSSADISFYKGITTILSYKNTRPDNKYIELDGKNIALWKYINVYQDPKGIFNDNAKSYKMENGKLWREDSYWKDYAYQYENAYKIYNAAIEARNGREISKLVFYVLKGNGEENQRMVAFEEGDIIPLDLKVKIQKTDTLGNPIPGTTTSNQATFQITGSENVKSISGLTSSNTRHTVDANGYTPVITITPQDPTKQVKIYVKETDSPDGYIKANDMTIIIQYYTNENPYGVRPGYIRVMYKNDTSSSNCIANYSAGEIGQEIGIIKIENDKVRENVNLRIVKQDEAGNALEGVTFKITSGSNIASTAIKSHTTISGGEINVNNIISNKDIAASFVIQETSTLDGYKLYNTPITITYTPGVGDDFSVSANIGKNSEFLGVSKSGNTIILRYANLKNNQMIIHKTDENGNPLAGVKFSITLNLVRSVKVNGTTVQYSNANDNYSGQLVLNATTDTNGNIILSEIKSFYLLDVDMNGDITSADARLISRMISGLESHTTNQGLLTDLNGDGYIYDYDAEETAMQQAVNLVNGKFVSISGTIHETQTLSGYKECADTVFNMKYRNTTKTFQTGTISGAGTWASNSETIKVIEIKNYKNYPTKLTFEFLKQNGISNGPLAGAQFAIYITDSSDSPLWKTSSSPYTTGETGLDGKTVITITDEASIKKLCNAGDVRIYFKETKTPDNYSSIYAIDRYNRFISCKISGEKIVSKVSYQNDNYYIQTNSNTYTIYNYPSLTFEFLKQDSDKVTNLSGAGFKFYITSESDPNTKLWASSTEYMTGSNGKIVVNITDIAMIKRLCNAGNLKIWFLETTTPDGYTSIYSDSWDYRTCKVSETKLVATNTFSNENYAITSGSNIYTIYNHKQIDIGGYVWLDGQTGIKPVNFPNGAIDEGEIGVEGVKVELLNSSGSVIQTAKTDYAGFYRFAVTPEVSYTIRFNYEGINYERTIDGASMATEIGRNTFNSRFKTISNDGTLEYKVAGNTSTLITGTEKVENAAGEITSLDMAGTFKEENNDRFGKFRMSAATAQTNYTQDTYNINFGLLRRGVDLSLATDVYSATVSINGKSAEYNYNQILAGALSDPTRDDKVIYNLSLYESDYNYRLEDYFNGQLNTEPSTDEIDSAKAISPQLNVDVTYAIYLNNQSANTAYVNSIVDYFDQYYTYKSCKYFKYSSSGETEIVGTISASAIDAATINGIGYNKITFSGLNVEDLKDGEQNILYVTFTVNKDEKGIKEGDFKNIAEITSYSTDNGCVDKDSAPDNITTNFKEDDTDEAYGINISIGEKTRSVTGIVWEDSNADGKMDAGEKAIKDVIVQLVELKDITVNGVGYKFEYIWQETLSGSNSVYAINLGGNVTYNYNPKPDETKVVGEYTFTGFIPGNYVIRFIYGDGTTATCDMTGNMIKYNGQDYKSTKDPSYNIEWYSADKYTNTQSVARDNEARRLKVMSYSTLVDSEKGMLLKLLDIENPEEIDINSYTDTEKQILISAYNNLYEPDINELTVDYIKQLLKEQVLENTWMNADTSKVDVPVDNDNDSTNSSVNYPNMNFGLTLRPINKLTLEKHVSSMKLTTTGTGTSSITDAKLDENGDLIGLRKGLITDTATRTSRGFWKLETDIEELLQGATLDVTYTYIVKQEGDQDYLSEDLVKVYDEAPLEQYTQFLVAKSGEKQPNSTYLSNSYYVGGEADKTKSRVESIEDYYEHLEGTGTETKDLIFNEEKNTDFAITNKNDDGTIKTADKSAWLISNTGVPTKNNKYAINKVVESTPTKVLGLENAETEESESTDTKTVKVSKVLSSYSEDDELNFNSYIAQISAYSTATGRRDMESAPGNLDYIYSEDSEKGLVEEDEFWAEPITITKSTGENKMSTTTIVIILTSALAVIAVAAITIKKYVLIKKH